VSGGLNGNAQIRVNSSVLAGQPTLTVGSGITVLGGATDVVSNNDDYGIGSQYVQQLTNNGTVTATNLDNRTRYMRMKAVEIDHSGMISSLSSSTFSISTDTFRHAGSIMLDSNARLRFRKDAGLNWDMDMIVQDGGEFVLGIGSATGTGIPSDGLAGVLEFEGLLDLRTSDDYLTIVPQAGFDPARTYTIITYGGNLLGAFDHVTPGYLLDYSVAGKISLRTVPEPSAALAAAALLLFAPRGRRRSCAN
jgi:hypothetical protein